MKIVTVNLPVLYLKEMDKYIGGNKTFPSRSELIRVAVRDYLIDYLQASDKKTEPTTPPIVPELNSQSITITDEKGQKLLLIPSKDSLGNMVIKQFKLKN